jgi:hypothetical protein
MFVDGVRILMLFGHLFDVTEPRKNASFKLLRTTLS